MTAPWAVVELDPERVAAELARRFPGVSAWRGEFTGRWWAVARDWAGRDRLVEAPTPAALAQMLHQIGAGPRPRSYAQAGASGRSPRTAPRRCADSGGPARHECPRRSGWFRRAIGALVA